MTVSERISAKWRRLAAWTQERWTRLLNMNLPIWKGYFVLCLLVLLLFGLALGAARLVEMRLVAAVRERPTDSEVYEDLWQFYWRAGSLRRYKVTLQSLAAEFPDNVWPWVELAWLDYQSIPREDVLSSEGLGAADRAARLADNEDAPLLSLARLYYWVGQYDRVSQVANKALAIAPDSSEAHFWAGQALKQSGDLQAAELELVTATREMSITLHADYMLVQTHAEIDTPPKEILDSFTTGHSNRTRELAWGCSSIGPARYFVAGFDQPTAMATDPSKLIISDQGFRIDYDDLWDGAYKPDAYPQFTIEGLPLSAYRTATTITVIADGTQVYSTTHPYGAIENGKSWQFSSGQSPVPTFGVIVEPNQFQRLKLLLSANYAWRRFAYLLLWASSTVLGSIVFVRIRRDAHGTKGRGEDLGSGNLMHVVHHALRPVSAFSWIFDAALTALGSLTVLYPIWLRSQNYQYTHHVTYLAFVCVFGLLWLRLFCTAWVEGRGQDANFVLLGAIIFVCYLVPAFTYSGLGPLYLVVNAAVCYAVLIRDYLWLSRFDWTRLKHLFSQDRNKLIEQIATLSQLPKLKNAFGSQGLALAKGQQSVAEFKESQQLLGRILGETQNEVEQLRSSLGMQEEDGSLKDVLFKLGPEETPLGNGWLALVFGLAPYLILTILASWSGDVSVSYMGKFDVSDIYYSAENLLGMPWGPFYLLFFGYFFRVIWGNAGATKGLVFAGVLAGLNIFYTWLWQWDQMDVIQVWGMTIRLLVTFVFTGVIMDWKTVGFSWRRISLLYDSPVYTTIITVAGTALTTLIAGLATGTIDRLLNVALQGLSVAFGAQPPSGLP
jgi:tetratricopeptide (TPR) repeat protein